MYKYVPYVCALAALIPSQHLHNKSRGEDKIQTDLDRPRSDSTVSTLSNTEQPGRRQPSSPCIRSTPACRAYLAYHLFIFTLAASSLTFNIRPATNTTTQVTSDQNASDPHFVPFYHCSCYRLIRPPPGLMYQSGSLWLAADEPTASFSARDVYPFGHRKARSYSRSHKTGRQPSRPGRRPLRPRLPQRPPHHQARIGLDALNWHWHDGHWLDCLASFVPDLRLHCCPSPVQPRANSESPLRGTASF